MYYGAKVLMASTTLSGSAYAAIMPQLALPVSPPWVCLSYSQNEPIVLYANVPKSLLILLLPSWPAQLNHPPNTYYNVFLPSERWPVVPSFTTYRIITLQSAFEAVELLQREAFQARNSVFEKMYSGNTHTHTQRHSKAIQHSSKMTDLLVNSCVWREGK